MKHIQKEPFVVVTSFRLMGIVNIHHNYSTFLAFLSNRSLFNRILPKKDTERRKAEIQYSSSVSAYECVLKDM